MQRHQIEQRIDAAEYRADHPGLALLAGTAIDRLINIQRQVGDAGAQYGQGHWPADHRQRAKNFQAYGQVAYPELLFQRFLSGQ